MKKTIWWAVGIVAIVIIAILLSSQKEPTTKTLKIGMLLPLSGSAAQYGEQIKNGAEIYRKRLADEGRNIEIIYEDNKADPATAISAYRKLIDIDRVDYMVSAMTRATIPLIDLVKQDKVPMIMTLVAGDWDKAKTGYVVRFYPTARQYVRSDDENKVLNGLSSVGVIYVNDEYGQSVFREIQKFSVEKGFKIGIAESYLPNNQDYRLLLSKIKSAGIDLIMMISSSPVELSAISKQYKELGIKQKLFDASIGLSNPNVRLNNADILEGVVTRATEAELPDKDSSAEEFFIKYKDLYNKDPYFPGIFGYETINLINVIDLQESEDFIAKISDIKALKTIMGDLVVEDYQEINPSIYNAIIKNGKLIRL